MRKASLLVGLLALGTTGCGGGGGGGGGSDAAVDAPAEVPLVGAALDGNCPAGSQPPGTGVTAGTELHRVTLDDYPEARCNDGSPAIMYVRRAATPAAEDDWVIFLQFGGACQSWEVCRDRWCSYQTSYDAAKMSSRFAPEVIRGNGLLSRGASNAFGAANQVFVYYCSSDQWTGRNGDVVLDDPPGVGPSYRLHFNGFSIVQAVDQALSSGVTSDDGAETLPPLTAATRILFAGGSAGSGGQTHALDWWRAQHPSAQVVGLLDAANDPLVEDVPDPAVATALQGLLPTRHQQIFLDLYGAHLDESCVAAHPGADAYLCSVGSHVRLNHITTPFLVRQDLRDPVGYGAFEMLGLPLAGYANALHATMTRYVTMLDTAEEKAAMTRAPGVHVSNCQQHIVALNDGWFGTAATHATVELPGGMPISLHDALGAWIGGAAVRAIDTQPSTTSVCLSTTDDQ